MSEQTDFLKELDINEKKDDVLEKPLVPEEPKEVKEETEEDTEFKAKNRRERRLLEKNQQLREEAIANAARAQALSEVNKFREEVGDDHLKEVEAIFGTDTPEKLAATNILKKALSGLESSAVEKALGKIQEQQSNESKAVVEEERNLDEIGDYVEDNYGINMETEGPGFYTLLEKLSPKDAEGNIIEYADADAVAEVYVSRKGKTNDRAKELANRSMTHSGTSGESKLQEDATWKALKELGIF